MRVWCAHTALFLKCQFIGILQASSFAWPQLTYGPGNRPVLSLNPILKLNDIMKAGFMSVFETRKCENAALCTGPFEYHLKGIRL